MDALNPTRRRWTRDDTSKFDGLLDAGKEAAEIALAINRARRAVYSRLQRVYRKQARLKAKPPRPLPSRGVAVLFGCRCRNRALNLCGERCEVIR
jgi:hypothetical protein